MWGQMRIKSCINASTCMHFINFTMGCAMTVLGQKSSKTPFGAFGRRDNGDIFANFYRRSWFACGSFSLGRCCGYKRQDVGKLLNALAGRIHTHGNVAVGLPMTEPGDRSAGYVGFSLALGHGKSIDGVAYPQWVPSLQLLHNLGCTIHVSLRDVLQSERL